MNEVNKENSAKGEYEAPKVERVVTSDEMEREVLYAGNIFTTLPPSPRG